MRCSESPYVTRFAWCALQSSDLIRRCPAQWGMIQSPVLSLPSPATLAAKACSRQYQERCTHAASLHFTQKLLLRDWRRPDSERPLWGSAASRGFKGRGLKSSGSPPVRYLYP